jgi:hypothetical protein
MIFPEKPRPPWRQTHRSPLMTPSSGVVEAAEKPQRPQGYWRERIEFALIVIGMCLWIRYWLQFQ